MNQSAALATAASNKPYGEISDVSFNDRPSLVRRPDSQGEAPARFLAVVAFIYQKWMIEVAVHHFFPPVELRAGL